MFSAEEKRFLRKLKTPDHIQGHLDQLTYNPDYTVASPRYVMLTNSGHCFEGCLLAAAALEVQGIRPMMINLTAHNDDNHALTVYKTHSGWGSFSKSNTTLLRGRSPVYKNVRELVMSYFDFYFNVKGQLALYEYTNPIHLSRYDSWNWRETPDDLIDMAMKFAYLPHQELISLKELKKLKPVSKAVREACFLGADPSGLFKA